jgi:hypothetical protein
MLYDQHPTCWRCRQPIHRFESLWRELPSGAVRASYAVDLETLGGVRRRLWHVGCYDPLANPGPRRDRAAVRPQQPPLLTMVIV